MKKKYGLFKVLAVLLLLVVVATYFIKGRQDTIRYMPVGDVFLNYIQSFYFFFDTALFIFVVGGFYGVLSRIPAYNKLVKGIAEKVRGNRKKFVIISTVIFALLSSVTGLNLMLLILVPFVVSIILLLGYDKLVALSATIGGILVGFIGGVFITFKDAASQYAVIHTTFDKLVGLDGSFDNVFVKGLMLVIVIALLVIYITNYIKKVGKKEVKYDLTKGDSLFVELKDKTDSNSTVANKRVIVWPLVIILFALIVLLVLGYLPWTSLFGIDIFEKFHTWLTGIKVGEYAVFTNLISNNFVAFGEWANLSGYMMAIFVIALFAFILKLIYGIKFEEAMDGFVYGVKKMVPATMLVMLAYCVLVCCYNNGFVETIIANATDKFGDNVIVHGLFSVLGSITNVDLYYTTSGIFSTIVSGLTENANLSVYSIMFQSIYGLVQLIGPTSLILIVGLSYLEVPYKTWVKYIWRFVIQLVIAIVLVLIIVSLL